MTSDAAAARRTRMLDAALRLAADGGYEAVQMRRVAADANVALGTLYRHYPSKIHLLVAGLGRELERLRDRIDRAILRGETPYDRLMVVVGALTRSLQREAGSTQAMTRALVSADASANPEVARVGELLASMFAHALSNAEPTEPQLDLGRLVGDVWLANLVAWVNDRASVADVAARLELAAGLLLGTRHAADLLP